MLQSRRVKPSAALAAVFAANGAAIFTWLPRLPDLQTKLGVDIPTLAWIAFAASAGGIVASQLAPAAMRRYGTTAAVAAGGFGLLAATAASVLTPSALVVGVALAFAGLGDGLEDVAMNTAGVTHQRSLARPILQRLHAAWSGGALAGSLAATAAAALRISLTTHILTVNAVLLVVTLLALSSLPTGDPPDQRAAVVARFRGEPAMRRSVLIVAVAVLLVAVAEGVPSEWPPVLLTNERGVGPGAAAVATTLFLASMAVARSTGDHLIAQYGNRRTLIAGMTAAAIGSAVGFGIESPAAVYAGVVLMGAGAAYAFPTLFTIAGDDPNIGAGDGAALVSGVARVGFLAYPPLIAWLEPTIGLGPSLQAATIAAVVVILLVRFGIPDDR